MEKIKEIPETEIVQPMPEGDIKIADMLPTMNVAHPQPPEKEECIVPDEKILGVYDEILNYCREDRKTIDDILTSMVDMVLNDGDSSSSTKEAMVNLIKTKSDCADKMSKVADLMTRIKLRDKDTYKAYMNTYQNNKVTIETSNKDLLKKVLKDNKNKGIAK
jgi:hypothetical protein